jgi:hypothetical protein
VAAETVLSDVQGAEGRLIIRGKEVGDLARDFDFEQTAQHLWAGFFDRDLSGLSWRWPRMGTTSPPPSTLLRPARSRPARSRGSGQDRRLWSRTRMPGMARTSCA